MAAESTKVGSLNCTDVAFCRDCVICKGVALRVETHTRQSKQSVFSRKSDYLPFPLIYRVKIMLAQPTRLDSPTSQCLEIHWYECCSMSHIKSAQLMVSSEQALDLQSIQNCKSLCNTMGPVENQNASKNCLKLNHELTRTQLQLSLTCYPAEGHSHAFLPVKNTPEVCISFFHFIRTTGDMANISQFAIHFHAILLEHQHGYKSISISQISSQVSYFFKACPSFAAAIILKRKDSPVRC